MTLEEEFKILAVRRESFENQVKNTFNLVQKESFKAQIKKVDLMIDKLLDEYNEARKEVVNG